MKLISMVFFLFLMGLMFLLPYEAGRYQQQNKCNWNLRLYLISLGLDKAEKQLTSSDLMELERSILEEGETYRVEIIPALIVYFLTTSIALAYVCRNCVTAQPSTGGRKK